ncbi:MAG: NADH-quinone oxidoreductase subunit A [Promethearchaeota archaeon]
MILLFVELVVAFLLVILVSSLIYLVGRRLSPKQSISETAQSSYACGEKAYFKRPRISVSLYKYFAYFLILDSAILIIAFASLGLSTINLLGLFCYLVAILISSILLLKEGDK